MKSLTPWIEVPCVIVAWLLGVIIIGGGYDEMRKGRGRGRK